MEKNMGNSHWYMEQTGSRHYELTKFLRKIYFLRKHESVL